MQRGGMNMHIFADKIMTQIQTAVLYTNKRREIHFLNTRDCHLAAWYTFLYA
jgi:hypothetical protein